MNDSTRTRCLFMFAGTMFMICRAHTQPPLNSPCGGWIPFRNEKCVKLVSRAGLQTKEDAEIICKSFSEELHGEEAPKLVTVKTEEKQNFLHKLLFEELSTLDNVWLGLDLNKDGVFRWNDGTDLFFTNWANEVAIEPLAESERNCVKMESGEGVHKVGKWVKENCKKRNVVVCERTQTWTVAELQNIVLSLKLETEKNKQDLNEANQELSKAKKEISEAQEKIVRLQNNPVPAGFIYVQLSGQQPPTVLWPQIQWTDVTSTYAGLFFRAGEGNAAPFGQVQEENTKRLEQVEAVKDGQTGNSIVPVDGSWSSCVHSGIYINGYSWVYTLRFRLSTGEIRPRNQAVRIWQRK